MKYFIITIDTEGDNLWSWKQGNKIKTDNTLFLQRFQLLAEQYGFKPVWLSNYEMLSDDRYIEFISKVVSNNAGELGMHLHAWSTPPEYTLPIRHDNAPYLVEYPFEIMEEKISQITQYISDRTGVKPISHRAGRWAMDDKYYALLEKYGYTIDCSVTPHIDWSKSIGQTENGRGCDYSSYPEEPYFIGNVLEIPVTVRQKKSLILNEKKSIHSLSRSIYHMLTGSTLWLRPDGKNLNELLYLVKVIKNSNSDYLMFMIHSSELMPGGSPTFKNKEAIEKLYIDLKILFEKISENFQGCTLCEYYNNFQSSMINRKLKL